MAQIEKLFFKDWCRNCRMKTSLHVCKDCCYVVVRELYVVQPPNFQPKKKSDKK